MFSLLNFYQKCDFYSASTTCFAMKNQDPFICACVYRKILAQCKYHKRGMGFSYAKLSVKAIFTLQWPFPYAFFFTNAYFPLGRRKEGGEAVSLYHITSERGKRRRRNGNYCKVDFLRILTKYKKVKVNNKTEIKTYVMSKSNGSRTSLIFNRIPSNTY